MTELIGAHNPRIQQLRRSTRAGRALDDGRIVAEGPHLLEDALGSSWRVDEILATAAAAERFGGLLRRANVPLTVLSDRAFAALSTTEHSQGLTALLRPRAWSWMDVFGSVALIVILDALQDPGNAGTVIRSAEAFGATGVVFAEGSVRVSNGKLLRAAAGSLFRMPFLENISAAQIIQRLREQQIALLGLAADASSTLGEAEFRQPCALLVGNEGAGLSPALRTHATGVSIPTRQVDSLNAAVACSIALYEAARQRSSR